MESHSLVIPLRLRDGEWHLQGRETAVSKKPKNLSLAYWLLNEKGENTTSCFRKSSLLISFGFTICVQK